MAVAKTESFFSARAPAKILLAGEHAVVHGAPAIGLAINRFATTTVRPREGSRVSFTLSDLKNTFDFTLATLRRVRDRLLLAYRQFIEGKKSIREVITAPGDLFQFALASLLDICKLELEEGLDIHLCSSIPIGCGMGSSAATIVSLVRALLYHFGIERGVDWIEKLIHEVERLQHGTPSGVDSFISLHGGCVRFQRGGPPKPLEMPSAPIWAINTGSPKSSTGECVSAVSKKWKKSSIWEEFGEIAFDVERALATKKTTFLATAFSRNQRLLETIGVVPDKVKAFVKELELQQGSAKISGAGSIRGQSAGILLAISDESSDESVEQLCQKYGYECFQLEGERSGATVSNL